MKNCVDCNKRFECRSRNCRCCNCQKKHRIKYLCRYHKKWWQRNKHLYSRRWITRLGGQEVTLREIRNYKKGIAENSPYGNEAQYMKGAKTYYTEEEYSDYVEE